MAKRTLIDKDYLRAKETGNENSEKGAYYEDLLVLWLLVRLGSLQIAYQVDLSLVTIEHHPGGQFIEDVKLSLHDFQVFYHAKSGAKLKWDENLERDFRAQPEHLPQGGRCRIALYVGSTDKRREMLDTIPPEMPQMAVYVLDANWLRSVKSQVPRIRRHLEIFNADMGSASLDTIWRQLRRAWEDLRMFWYEKSGTASATLQDVLLEANLASGGSVKTGERDDRTDMMLVANQLRKIPGLWVARDDNSLRWTYGILRGRLWLGNESEPWERLYERLAHIKKGDLTIEYLMNEI